MLILLVHVSRLSQGPLSLPPPTGASLTQTPTGSSYPLPPSPPATNSSSSSVSGPLTFVLLPLVPPPPTRHAPPQLECLLE